MIDILKQNGLYLLIGGFPQEDLGGLALTLILSLLCMVIVFPCAVLVALARTSRWRFLSTVMAAYVNFIRTIPLLLIIFWVYLFAPVLLGYPVTGFATIVLAIAINQTAFLSEVIRSGILAIPKGQIETAQALGLSSFPVAFRVVLPQALFNVSPGILNVLTIIVKETSLGYMVGLSELTLTASHVNSLTLTKPMQVFAIVAVAYFIICYGLSRIVNYLERRVERRRLGVL